MIHISRISEVKNWCDYLAIVIWFGTEYKYWCEYPALVICHRGQSLTWLSCNYSLALEITWLVEHDKDFNETIASPSFIELWRGGSCDGAVRSDITDQED